MPERRTTPAPAVSVVIPTYNRHDLLRRTLESLCAQCLTPDCGTEPIGLEVVVSDDGSSDSTEAVARSFADRLNLRYVFQPDEGVRIAAARNHGARHATAPVLIFLDTGVLAGPGLVRSHLAAHAAHAAGGTDAPGSAVLGYTYGYNPFDPYPGLSAILDEHTPEQVRKLLGCDERFRDKRHDDFERFAFDLGRMVTSWTLFWTMNVSVQAADFHAVGGFDEGFRDWGGEDVELGWRLASHGVSFVASREAWAIESPHERDLEANIASNRRNAGRLFEKDPGLVTELYAANFSRWPRIPLEDEYQALIRWSEVARVRDAAPRWDLAVCQSAGRRVAILGCGTTPAPEGAAWTLIDFDAELLRRRAALDSCALIHGLGVRTPFPDCSFDVVVVSSRLTGLWERWGSEIEQEVARLAPEIHVLAGDA